MVRVRGEDEGVEDVRVMGEENDEGGDEDGGDEGEDGTR